MAPPHTQSRLGPVIVVVAAATVVRAATPAAAPPTPLPLTPTRVHQATRAVGIRDLPTAAVITTVCKVGDPNDHTDHTETEHAGVDAPRSCFSWWVSVAVYDQEQYGCFFLVPITPSLSMITPPTKNTTPILGATQNPPSLRVV